MCSQQSKGAKRPQKSFNRADAFFIKITRFHAVLKPIFRSLKPFQAFSSLLNLRARDFSFYMNTYSGVDRVITAPADWAQNNNDDLLFAHYKAVAQELPIMLMTALGKRPVPLNVIEETVNTVPELIAIKDDICRHYGQHVATFARKGDVTLLSGGRMEDHLEVLSLWLQFLVVHFYALYAAHRLGLLGGRAGEEYVAWS